MDQSFNSPPHTPEILPISHDCTCFKAWVLFDNFEQSITHRTISKVDMFLPNSELSGENSNPVGEFLK